MWVITGIWSILSFIDGVTSEKESNLKAIITEKYRNPSGMPRPSGSAGFRGGGFPGGGGFGFTKPDGVDDATWQKAQAACASLRPSFGGGGGRNGGNGMNAAYRNCLKEHGVTTTGKLDPADPTVKKAMDTCKVLQPSATPSA